MLSIANHMDEFDIATEVKLERKVHKGSFFLVEGATDIVRFGAHIDKNLCSLVNCYGRDKVIRAIQVLYNWGFVGALGAVDKDFDEALGQFVEMDDLVYSESHDFDLDWATPAAVGRYLDQVGNPAKCSAHGDSAALVDRIMEGLKPVSVAKLLNAAGKIEHKLSHIDVQICTDGFVIEIASYVDTILRNEKSPEKYKSDIEKMITNALTNTYDLRQITNGHDFHAALGVCLRSRLGERRDVHTWGSEIEWHLRLAFQDSDLRQTKVFAAIRSWEDDNPPYLILADRYR
jgi:hypothetical protein